MKFCEFQLEFFLFVSGLLNKKTLRDNVKNYVNGSKMMLYLEEEAQAHYLKKFDQRDIQVTYHMDRQFYFPVTVCFDAFSLDFRFFLFTSTWKFIRMIYWNWLPLSKKMYWIFSF